MQTALQLLTRDGAIHVAFSPRLSAEQYAELMILVEATDTKDELSDALRSAALQWGKELEIEDGVGEHVRS
jgi:hypothetical protein